MKPEHEIGRRETKDTLWKAIRRRKEFTIGDLRKSCDLDYNTIALYVRALTRAGYLTRRPCPARPRPQSLKSGYRTRHIYTLVKDAFDPPRVRKDGSEVTQGKGTQRMWNTLRARKIVTLADIWALSKTTRHTAGEYLRYLEKAGYIRNMYAGSPVATYRLIRDTGPKAPMIQRVKHVWDPNLKKIMWPIAAKGGNNE